MEKARTVIMDVITEHRKGSIESSGEGLDFTFKDKIDPWEKQCRFGQEYSTQVMNTFPKGSIFVYSYDKPWNQKTRDYIFFSTDDLNFNRLDNVDVDPHLLPFEWPPHNNFLKAFEYYGMGNVWRTEVTDIILRYKGVYKRDVPFVVETSSVDDHKNFKMVRKFCRSDYPLKTQT